MDKTNVQQIMRIVSRARAVDEMIWILYLAPMHLSDAWRAIYGMWCCELAGKYSRYFETH